MGLITDTGRFMYENTGPRAHRMAAELIEAGVDVHEIYRRVYEGVPYGKLALLARGLAKVERFDAGRLTVTGLDAADFAASDAEESYSEGVIDHLRAVQGTAVAALVRDRIGDANGEGRPLRKVSLRASDDRVDVSRIARVAGGGGHRQAAGFTTAMEWPELVEFLREEVAQQLRVVTSRSYRPPWTASSSYDKPAGITSHDVVARVRRGRRGLEGRPRRHARPVRHRAAAGAARAGHARAAVPDGAAQDLRGDRALRRGLEHRRPRGRDRRHRRRARRRARAARPARSASARRPTRRSRSAAAAPTSWPAPASTSSPTSARSTVYRFEERWREGDRRGFEIECSSGTYVRSLIADLGDAYCEELRRTRIGSFDVADADPERVVELDEALAFMPEVRLAGEDAAAGRARGGRAGRRGAAPAPRESSGSPTSTG